MMIPFSDLFKVLTRPSRGFRAMLGYTAKQEKPYIDEMMPDIIRKIHKTAHQYTDNTCYALRFEDLVAEQMAKFAQLLNKTKKGTNKNVIEAIDNRDEAFKFIATCLNNHARGLVIKHRQTKKRTIQSTDEDDAFSERSKHCEISIDSEEAGIQLQDMAEAESGGGEALVRDMAPLLTPIELAVIRELNDPSRATLAHMMLDHSVGRLKDESVKKYKLKFSHHAKGVGLPLDLFKQTVTQIGEKIKIMRKQEDDLNEPAWNAAVARLEEAFMVQVPRSMEKIIVRRLFTLAARDQYQRWEGNEEIKKDLLFVGAQLPQLRAGLMVCFGVLYQNGHKVCRACSLQDSCSKEAANNGLGEISIHPRLVGNRQIRVPVISAAVVEDSRFHLEPAHAEIYNWIRENFKFIEEVNGKILFKRPGVAGTNATALAVTVEKKPFKITLHSVEDPALIECGILESELDGEDYNVKLGTADQDQLVALLTTHLEAHYAIRDANSCI